ncbi:MAG TPA: AMP-binding protein [Solirubrobacteraceae bacterium]|nr:AMP-binding protein [Solirubrobacteraceae bacterium]
MVPWLIRAAAVRPDHPALVTPTERLTYVQLEARARSAAGAMTERGVRAGDRVALALPAGADYCATLHGCLLLGAVAVPIDLRLAPAEREMRQHSARIVVEGPLHGPTLEGVPRVETDDVATLMHTSGTTAAPKPVPLSYGNWLANALGSAVALGLDQQERWLCPLPLAHVGGLSVLIRSAIYATTVVLGQGFDAEAVAAALRDSSESITLVSVVATMLERMLDAGLRGPPTLRWALLGGGPIPAGLLERANAHGVPVAPTYGMTEACSQIATFGFALPETELAVSGDGEILVRGPTVSRAVLSADGWLHTGDLGELDDRGRLSLAGRLSDVIVSGGENVAPVEVEEVLLTHPAVIDAAVYGRPDEEWGEVVVAAVLPRDGIRVDASELRAHCAERLARFKVPKSFQFVDKLPRTASGKLLRRRLGQDLAI